MTTQNLLKNGPRLASEQVARYERDGYTLVKQPLFAPDKFAPVKLA